MYTLILSCRNLGIDTRDYLIDVLGRIRGGWPVSRLSELTTDAWAGQARSGG
ncbi:MAG: transposase domain-containing protein [Myxococcales bacterium]|nr:transposase domain-containing protein [Myxococcales bacterium]